MMPAGVTSGGSDAVSPFHRCRDAIARQCHLADTTDHNAILSAAGQVTDWRLAWVTHGTDRRVDFPQAGRHARRHHDANAR